MRKFLILALAVILAVGMMGGAFAYFTDTETSSGNTFTAGTMELQINDGSPDEWGDGCSGTWILPEIVPGANVAGLDKVTGTVTLKRIGSIIPDHLEVQAFISIDEDTNPVESDTNPGSTAAEMAAKLEITQLQYDSVDPLNDYLVDADGDGKKTLNDMTYPAETNGLDGLPIPTTNAGTAFLITFKWIQGTDDNDFQGDILNAEIAFTLNQNTSQ